MAFLTKSETDIIRMLAYGMTCKEIAEATGRFAKTVEVHTYNIRKKAGGKSMIRIVYILAKNNII